MTFELTHDFFYGSVMDYLNTTFLSFEYEACTEYVVGTVLHTRLPRFRTNATIIEVTDVGYKVLTDIGNILWVSIETLREWYLAPIYKRV